MSIKDKLDTNWRVLKEQAQTAWVHIKLDISNGVMRFRDGDYAGAFHNWIFGPPAEITEHAHRWVFYGLILAGLYWLA